MGCRPTRAPVSMRVRHGFRRPRPSSFPESSTLLGESGVKTYPRNRLPWQCLAALLGILALAGCQTAQSTTPTQKVEALARPEPIVAEGVYVHQVAPFRFPPTIEDFKRTELLKYDAEALDVSATYHRSGPVGAALGTIYVYPAPWVQGGNYPDLTDRQLGGLCRGVGICQEGGGGTPSRRQDRQRRRRRAKRRWRPDRYGPCCLRIDR